MFSMEMTDKVNVLYKKIKQKQTIDWDSTVNDMVYADMIAPLALTLHIQLGRYCLHCHLSAYLMHVLFHHLVFHLEFGVFAVMLDLNLKNCAAFCTAELEFPILNRNVQSLFTKSN